MEQPIIKSTSKQNQNEKIPEKSGIKAPDGGWGWVVAFAAFINFNIIGGVTFTYGALLPGLTETFQENTFVLCWILGLQQFTCMGIGPLVSALCRKIGYRNTMILGGVISAFGMFLSAFANHVAYLFLTMGIIVGTGEGLLDLSGLIMVSLYFDKKRPLATGFALSGYGSGVIISGFLFPYMIEEYTWRGACILLAGIFLQCCIGGALIRPLSELDNNVISNKKPADNSLNPIVNRQPPSPLLTSNGTKEPHKGENPAFESSTIDLSVVKEFIEDPGSSNLIASQSTALKNLTDEEKPKKGCLHLFWDYSLLKNIPFVVFFMANFLSNVSFTPPITFILHRSIEAGFTQFDANTFLSVMGLSSWIGRLIFGALATIDGVDRHILFLISLLGMAVPNLLMPFFEIRALMFLFVILYGAFIGKFCVLQAVIVCDLVDNVEQVPLALGVITMANGWASLLGTPLGGFLYDELQTYYSVYVICGVIFMVATLLWTGVTFHRRLRKCRRSN